MAASIQQCGGVLSVPSDRLENLILGPSPTAKTRLLFFNRTQSRAVTGLLNGQSILRRYLHLMGLINTPLRRRCGAEEETSAHVLCKCVALASLRHKFGLLFLGPRGCQKSKSGGNLELQYRKRAPMTWTSDDGYKGPV